MTSTVEADISAQPSRLGLRLWHLLLGVAFTIAISKTYAGPIQRVWKYIGFTYFKPPSDLYDLAFGAAILPALFLPTKLKRPGNFIVWVIYFSVYIPSVIIPAIMGNLPDQTKRSLIYTLFAAMLIILIPAFSTTRTKPRLLVIYKSLFWQLFVVSFVALNLWVFFTFGAHLNLVGLTDIYSQRFEAQDVQEGSLVGYATGFLGGAYNPFLMAFGLKERRYFLVAISVAGQIFLFATAAAKSVLLAVILIPAFYFLIFRKEPFQLSRVGFAFATSAVALAVVGASAIYQNGVLHLVFTLVYMRTFCMVGVLMGYYTEFFQSHPLTYWSHIGVLRAFIDYPYDIPLGTVIGGFMVPSKQIAMDANASFLATDGMAAMGFAGIVISGVFFRIFIAIFNACSDAKTFGMMCCALAPVLITVSNASMFTTLLSGGGLLLALMFYFYSNAVDPPKPEAECPTPQSL